MSELREAAQEALFWMETARLHLTIKERLHPDGLIQYDNAARNLRAALAVPETAVRPCGECILAADEVCDICGANGTCDVPPMGWRCTRSAGHDGPCATVEAPEQVDFVNRGMDRLRDVQPETAEPVAWAVVCAGNAVSTCLTETAANLIAENLREKNRGRDFDWQTTPLYAHPPRDEWRPASEVPEDAMFSRGAVAAIVAGAIYDFAGFMTTRPVSVSIGASDACGPVVDLITSFAEKRGLDLEEAAVQSWNLCIGRDVQPPTEGSK